MIAKAYADRLAERGLTLPTVSAPAGAYVGHTRGGAILYVSGQIPVAAGDILYRGRVGERIGLEEAQRAAELCALNILAQVAGACRFDLDAVTRCLRLGVFVNAVPGFEQHPMVANGASELITAVLGERGRHARAAVGVASLPMGVAVEVDALFELDLDRLGRNQGESTSGTD